MKDDAMSLTGLIAGSYASIAEFYREQLNDTFGRAIAETYIGLALANYNFRHDNIPHPETNRMILTKLHNPFFKIIFGH